MNGDELILARERLLFALILAGVTGDETFGDLLDAIDEYVCLSVRAARSVRPSAAEGSAKPRSGGSTA